MRAERVQFVEDDQGWELHVTDEEGEITILNVHHLAWNLVDHMNDTIGDWRREGLAAVGLSSSGRDDLTRAQAAARQGDPDFDPEALEARGWPIPGYGFE